MASVAGPHTFVTFNVFTAEKYQGNPLAIVSVRANALSPEKKQLVAREFNYSETVFLHDAEPGQPRKVEVFTPTGEIAFGGHPIIGTLHYIFMYLERGTSFTKESRQTTTLLTKAGIIKGYFNIYRQIALADIPHDVHVQSKETPLDRILACQPGLKESGDLEKLKPSFPAVSMIKGMSFTLVDLTNVFSLMATLKAGEAPSIDLDDGWSPSFAGCMYYVELPSEDQEEPIIYKLRVRMMAMGIEDPASGAGSCALVAYLSLKRGGKNARHIYAIEQGVQMGRRSQICVEVQMNGQGDAISGMTMSGRATAVMEGRLVSVY